MKKTVFFIVCILISEFALSQSALSRLLLDTGKENLIEDTLFCRVIADTFDEEALENMASTSLSNRMVTIYIASSYCISERGFANRLY